VQLQIPQGQEGSDEVGESYEEVEDTRRQHSHILRGHLANYVAGGCPEPLKHNHYTNNLLYISIANFRSIACNNGNLGKPVIWCHNWYPEPVG